MRKAVLDDVGRVLRHPRISRRYAFEPQDIARLVLPFRDGAFLVPGQLTIPPTARDPDDDHILACALEGAADYLVTGDKDLLTLERYQAIPIVTPARFAALLEADR